MPFFLLRVKRSHGLERYRTQAYNHDWKNLRVHEDYFRLAATDANQLMQQQVPYESIGNEQNRNSST